MMYLLASRDILSFHRVLPADSYFSLSNISYMYMWCGAVPILFQQLRIFTAGRHCGEKKNFPKLKLTTLNENNGKVLES